MSGETGRKSESHLLKYRDEAISLERELGVVVNSATNGARDNNAIWEVYARTEKLIALMKFRFDFETPGVFVKLPEAKDPFRLLQEAQTLLKKAAGEISAHRPIEAIGTLRKARNNLRSYLTPRRRTSAKAGKSA